MTNSLHLPFKAKQLLQRHSTLIGLIRDTELGGSASKHTPSLPLTHSGILCKAPLQEWRVSSRWSSRTSASWWPPWGPATGGCPGWSTSACSQVIPGHRADFALGRGGVQGQWWELRTCMQFKQMRGAKLVLTISYSGKFPNLQTGTVRNAF